ncbi:hypothetical protein TNIN_3661 [Trichonephila inaurata madagascariensis]|uniref:Uncharacterized protein n=1 Tax=Trichonephila inaurata madagascariensis TaxID=2747483 RepID=A0A8X6MFT0_9ARAC|nr:hypothetical protein TNIN_3661 [Trichonephila inaurata madagascariensis]
MVVDVSKKKDFENPKSHFSKGEQTLTTYVPEIELQKKLVQDFQEERFKPKGDQSGPEENYLGGQARITRVDIPDSSPDNKVTNSWSRVRGMEDPVITFPDKVDTPDSKIVRRLIEVPRVGGLHHLKSILRMSRKEERSFSQVV